MLAGTQILDSQLAFTHTTYPAERKAAKARWTIRSYRRRQELFIQELKNFVPPNKDRSRRYSGCRVIRQLWWKGLAIKIHSRNSIGQFVLRGYGASSGVQNLPVVKFARRRLRD